ncbi:MAG: glycoside hydrolase family 65 protein, partial [Chitinivibrionales bacterium]|nr:glycoside hydrolase family 65 protein [Chitinivibrionales bacterium]
QYHLLPAIAHAIYRYHEATGDDEFLFRYGAEILFEMSRFLEDRGARIPHKNNAFCLNVVCGPDEYGCGVNNNCYTNVMTQWQLRYAAALHERMAREAPELLDEVCARISLGPEEPDQWREAAEDMYVPYNETLGIHEQDDVFLSLDPVDMRMVPRNTDIREISHPLNLWRMQVAKQADVVLLMFVQGHQFPADVKQRNYEFYEPRTCHGSSLSACIHAVLASELGRHEEAYDYYRESLMMDLNDFKDNTGGGVHSACLGGTWMAIVNGFAGMRDHPGGLSFDPWLPSAWNGYRFTVVYRGSRIGVEVDSDGTVFRLLEGKPVSFDASGEKVTLSDDAPVRVAARKRESVAD